MPDLFEIPESIGMFAAATDSRSLSPEDDRPGRPFDE